VTAKALAELKSVVDNHLKVRRRGFMGGFLSGPIRYAGWKRRV
jgi:hypothetical protein